MKDSYIRVEGYIEDPKAFDINIEFLYLLEITLKRNMCKTLLTFESFLLFKIWSSSYSQKKYVD